MPSHLAQSQLVQGQPGSAGSHAGHALGRSLLIAVRVGGLMLTVAWMCLAPASAQTTTPGTQPPSGMGPISPLNAGSPPAVPPTGIPLGSTELATPGISPVTPGLGAATANGGCAGSASAAQGTLFDGGGLSGGPSAFCLSQQDTGVSNSSAPTLSVGRAGIPLGSVELGGTGLSPAPPLASAVPPPSMSAMPPGSAVPCPTDSAAAATNPNGC
jgi:hypothetical protein